MPGDNNWRKSTYSLANGNCAQVMTWRKSNFSHANGQCVQAASAPRAVLVGDSKDPDGPVLAFSAEAWRRFTAGTTSTERTA